MKTTFALLVSVLFALAALFLSSCAGYNQAWQEAVASYHTGETEGPEGPWTGSWKTETNGHSGALRCIVEPAPEQPGTYKFRYHALWGGGIPAVRTVRYPVQRRDDRWVVEGEEKLFTGRFHHRATIRKDRFEASYTKDDGKEVGAFRMKRPMAED